MKKKLIVIVIAVVLVAAMVGTCFALYTRNADTRRVTLSTGDFVSLSIGGAAANFSLTGLSPDHDVTLGVTLNATNTNLAEDGVCGKFTVAISGTGAANVSVSAAGTDKNSTAVAYNNAALTAGQQIDLDDIPTNLTLTFKMSEISLATAEQELTITLSWIIDESTQWSVNADAYYVNGTYNGKTNWSPVNGSWILSETPNDGDCAKGTFTFAVGDTIKCVKGDNDHWFDWQDEATSDFEYNNGNLVIKTAGSYTIFLKYDNFVNKAYIQKNA